MRSLGAANDEMISRTGSLSRQSNDGTASTLNTHGPVIPLRMPSSWVALECAVAKVTECQSTALNGRIKRLNDDEALCRPLTLNW